MWEDELACQKCSLLVGPEDFPICDTCLWWREKLLEAFAKEQQWWDEIKERYGR